MSELVIRVENLGKRYRLGCAGNGSSALDQTLRETLTTGAQQLFRRRIQKTAEPDLWALRDLNFEVKRGEVLGIIGRNGAGKSTLLKILSRITEPTVGRVQITGRVGSLLEVGTGFHAQLTGRENIYLNGAILGMSHGEIERKFDEIVDFAEVHRFLDTPVKYYSSGMYVRLAFAVAANLDPEILLVDEVLAVGDAEFQKKCLGKMNEVAGQGRTVLLVSHLMNAVERFCSRALLIDNGQLRMESSDVRSVTRFYLAGGDTGSARAEWRNNGSQFENVWFQPRRVFLADGHGEVLRMPAKVDDEIWLHLVADVKEPDPGLVVGYAIYAESGELLYQSCQRDGRQEEWPSLRVGTNQIRGKIPSRLLNEGTYRLDLIGSLHFREWLFKPGNGEPSVFLDLRGGLSESPMRNNKRPGLLAPILPWESCDNGLS